MDLAKNSFQIFGVKGLICKIFRNKDLLYQSLLDDHIQGFNAASGYAPSSGKVFRNKDLFVKYSGIMS